MSDNDQVNVYGEVNNLKSEVSGIKAVLSGVKQVLDRLVENAQTNWATIGTCVGAAMVVVMWVTSLSREPLEDDIKEIKEAFAAYQIAMEIKLEKVSQKSEERLVKHEETDGHESMVKMVSGIDARLLSHIEMDQQRHDDLSARQAATELRANETSKNRYTNTDAQYDNDRQDSRILSVEERLNLMLARLSYFEGKLKIGGFR